MARVTATLDEDQAEYLATVREEADLESDAAAVRVCIDRAREYEAAQARAEAAEARVEDLRNQLQAANQRIDAANELVEYVDEERSLEERRRKAGLATRARWWLFGMDDEE